MIYLLHHQKYFLNIFLIKESRLIAGRFVNHSLLEVGHAWSISPLWRPAVTSEDLITVFPVKSGAATHFNSRLTAIRYVNCSSIIDSHYVLHMGQRHSNLCQKYIFYYKYISIYSRQRSNMSQSHRVSILKFYQKLIIWIECFSYSVFIVSIHRPSTDNRMKEFKFLRSLTSSGVKTHEF